MMQSRSVVDDLKAATAQAQISRRAEQETREIVREQEAQLKAIEAALRGDTASAKRRKAARAERRRLRALKRAERLHKRRMDIGETWRDEEDEARLEKEEDMWEQAQREAEAAAIRAMNWAGNGCEIAGKMGRRAAEGANEYAVQAMEEVLPAAKKKAKMLVGVGYTTWNTYTPLGRLASFGRELFQSSLQSEDNTKEKERDFII